MFNPSQASKKIKSDFIRYLCTSFKTCNEDFNNQFKYHLEHLISKGPFVDINDAFKKGCTLNDLINEGLISDRFRLLEQGKPSTYTRVVPLDRPLFLHQEKALREAVSKHNVVITTGTGSGKTESFLYPILDVLFKDREMTVDKTSGIKIILIYPMNALANDQINRIREILMFYPDITFGVFTGDTETNKNSAIAKYKEAHLNEKYKELQQGLPNEKFSRSEMYDNPPDILITNYVMLEYLLLRSDYSQIFVGADLRCIVLDESHVYRGATGMETSMLLRKLRARVGKAQTGIQYILTSATLGQKGHSEQDIVKFAEGLTNEHFELESIIFGDREKPDISLENSLVLQKTIWTELAVNEIVDEIPNIFRKYGLSYDSQVSPDENLYRVCNDSREYCLLRLAYSKPISLQKLADLICLDEDDAIAFLFVCSKSSRSGQPLVDIHYHFFVRALEGAYATFTKEKHLFLERKSHIVNSDSKSDCVFEIARCNSCGDIAIIGQIVKSSVDKKDYLVMQNSPFELGNVNRDDPQFFHIVRVDNEDDEDIDYGEIEEIVEDNDEVSDEKPAKKKSGLKGYWLCPHCGQIVAGELGKPHCGHPEEDMIKLKEIDDTDKCLFCSNGHYSGFYVGGDGATSVLGMSLFESLPPKKVEIKENGMTRTFVGGKQFLCFSDSRSEAAYFASYEDRTYNTFITRRGLVQYIRSISDDIKAHEKGYVTLDSLAKGLTNFFLANHSFSSTLLDNDNPLELKNLSENYSWMIILDQLVGQNRPNYLQSLGFFQFVYLGITNEMILDIKNKYLPTTESKNVEAFLSTLIMSFVRGGAIIHSDLNIDSFVRQYVFRSDVQNGMLEQKTAGVGVHNQSWIPQNLEGKSDKWKRSNRQFLVMNMLHCDGFKANEFLKYIWNEYIVNTQREYHAKPIGYNGAYALPRDSIGIIVSGHKDAHWYVCDKCKHVFVNDINGSCQIKNCNGHLYETSDLSSLFDDDYYYHVYETDYLRKLLIEEHTAQLNRKKGANYQEQFRNNLINALSCSTTFEMGVNLGHLETVFLRDMPPTAANYIQRAGRAGRSKDSSAFALTYAKLSSHDFDYYERPLDMISGKIEPPLIKENNKKIVFRHIFSVVLSYFFRIHPEFFDHEKKMNNVGCFVSKLPNSTLTGYETLKQIISQKPEELTVLLRDSFGLSLENQYKISLYGNDLSSEDNWVEELVGKNGRLECAVISFLQTKKELMTQYLDITSRVIQENRLLTDKEQKECEAIQRKTSFLSGQQLIDFLVGANVLPKYGFPVDTVELKLPTKTDSGLSLSRDMSQAISEYAPGCQVIADKMMFTPRYIAKVIRSGKVDFDEGFYCECGNPNCKTPNFVVQEKGQTCVGCGQTLDGVNMIKAIQPSAGMIADGSPKEVPSKRPKRLYHSQASYVGTFTENAKHKYSLNGLNITIISTENDKIMVTTPPEHPFYVCPACGYALGRHDIVYKEDLSGKKVKDTAETKKLQFGAATFVTCKHKMPNGGECKSDNLDKRILVHTFNTDIIQILFDGEIFETENTVLGLVTSTGISVLYALLSSISKILDIEPNDVSGCLIANNSIESTNYRFVIYDNVPGGAGHVKRILLDDGKILKKVIDKAIQDMNCDCTGSCYSCLKTYQNQRYHLLLDHEKARCFLEKYSGEVETSSTQTAKRTLQFIPSKLKPDSWEKALKMVQALVSNPTFTCLSTLSLDQLPDYASINIKIKGTESRAALIWPERKVLLLRKTDLEMYNCLKDSCDWKVFIGNDDFDSIAFIKELSKGVQ